MSCGCRHFRFVYLWLVDTIQPRGRVLLMILICVQHTEGDVPMDPCEGETKVQRRAAVAPLLQAVSAAASLQ
ncbi:hypothetical protein ACP4OV_003064 [Aristida adscensionis]